MSVKSRVTKLENQLSPTDDQLPISRQHFDLRVNRLKVGLQKFGYKAADEQVKVCAHEFLKARPGFAGLGFDIAEVGLSEVSACLNL